jgi:predicted LPLAT superfamily acyltransferase
MQRILYDELGGRLQRSFFLGPTGPGAREPKVLASVRCPLIRLFTIFLRHGAIELT